MHRVDTEGHDEGLFQDGSPQIGQQGTMLAEDWFNDLQENICGVIEDGAGAALVKGNYDQLRLAIAFMISQSAAATRVRPGVVEYFAGNVAPAGYLECNGSVQLRATYADLFAVVGTAFNTGGETGDQFRLPDLRGEFVRGWDHGRGIDAARTFGSAQSDDLKAHVHSVAPAASTDDTAAGATTTGSGGAESITPYNTGSTGGSETRPRNVALMAIIKT